MSPDYSKSKIYKIVSDWTDLVYVGSTISSLKQRMHIHAYNYHKYMLNPDCQYCSSYEIFDFGDARIELIESYPCKSKKELNLRETYYQKNLSCVNIRFASRTKKEYEQENKHKFKEYRLMNEDKIREYHKAYYQRNKKKFQEHNKKYYAENTDKVKELTKRAYERKKAFSW